MINFDLKSVKIAMNTKTILTPAEKAQVKLLKEFGGYCRRVMVNSIKRARNKFHHADKGKPPLYHEEGAINYKKTIFFVADVRQKNVVIGGVLLKGPKAAGDPVPGILEHGGAKFGSTKSRKHGEGSSKYTSRTSHDHPHAKPAYDIAIKKKLPSLIAGGIMREA